ncbi:hypothetical protein A0H81_09903 [Grifola frondosa]|uniref:Uncharacterized protein n=1 Tax=Grifola frondosa TaxID=5627 RepID=A0A1C7LZE7_GRIFR|nr:hypothetical protein A0H81_09903 [Grifola frondosa]
MNTEVRVFWHDRIGPQVSCAPAQSFCRAIGDWLNMLLDEITCDTLLLRLDEYAIGGITPSSLDRFVGNRSIREAIAYLGVVQVSPVDVAFESVDPSTVRPLLVWIDDYPENNTREVDYARDLGITVISIRSTAAAKVWIEANEALLRRTESVKRLRFISDNHRWESDQQASDYLNLSAGETMLRYLRGRLYTAPILIYCGASIVRTQYVLSYHRAGSTTDQNVCFSFIGALAQNVNNDNIWEQVDAHFISDFSPSLPRTIAENNLGSERIVSPTVHLESRVSRFSDMNAIEEFCSIGPGGGTTRGRLSFLTVDGDKNAASLFSSLPTRMEWADRRTAHPEQEEYRMLRLYTSLDGYKSIFAVLNEAFRSENLTGDRSRLHAAVFLIEVLTIELFNYMYRMSPTIGFSGTVYRGMRLRRDQLDQFYALTQRPVKERYWSIPLAFISTTTSLAISLKFAEPKGMPAPDSHAVLWRIRVADLEPALLAIYHERFPASVVTSLCAVRISDLSAFPEEEEILLRGPFFQLVYVATQPLGIPPGSAGVVHVVDGVMLNTNRDHPSTMEMGAEEGQRARALFACLVEIGRTKECLRLARSYGLREDVEEYTQVWRDAEQRLKILMGT